MILHNEIEPFAVEWLRNLAAAGLIDGPVRIDDRSIADLQPADLVGFDQCHFFSGIGGWTRALDLARWPAARPVWTGSCPCQPFSNAGQRKGAEDERHLWPEFARLIDECRPPVIFGEQVASKLGRAWLAGVQADLEGMGYAVGAADLCAAGVGAPHIRQRLYWGAIRLADANGPGRGSGREAAAPPRHGCPPGAENWASARWLECLDGKWRRIPAEPAFFPLAHGLPGRVGRLRAYGNAIVPQVAATFVMQFMEAIDAAQ